VDDQEDDVPSFTFTPPMMNALFPRVTEYLSREREKLGDPEPDTWHEIGQPWTGEGWRLICAQEVLNAHEACMRTGHDVFLHFD
jgi:hypothetical protein